MMLTRYRPVIGLINVTSFVMALYAVGVMYTPSSGIVAFLGEHTFLTPEMLAVAFLVCAGLIFFVRPDPAVVSVLTTPILLYAIAGVFYFFSLYPNGSFTGALSHVAVWLIITASLYERARSGTAH